MSTKGSVLHKKGPTPKPTPAKATPRNEEPVDKALRRWRETSVKDIER